MSRRLSMLLMFGACGSPAGGMAEDGPTHLFDGRIDSPNIASDSDTNIATDSMSTPMEKWHYKVTFPGRGLYYVGGPIATNMSSILFTVDHGPDGPDSGWRIYSVDKATGTQVNIVTDFANSSNTLRELTAMCADDDFVYFAEGTEIEKVPVGGGAKTTIGTANSMVNEIKAIDNVVVWTQYGGYGAARKDGSGSAAYADSDGGMYRGLGIIHTEGSTKYDIYAHNFNATSRRPAGIYLFSLGIPATGPFTTYAGTLAVDSGVQVADVTVDSDHLYYSTEISNSNSVSVFDINTDTDGRVTYAPLTSTAGGMLTGLEMHDGILVGEQRQYMQVAFNSPVQPGYCGYNPLLSRVGVPPSAQPSVSLQQPTEPTLCNAQNSIAIDDTSVYWTGASVSSNGITFHVYAWALSDIR